MKRLKVGVLASGSGSNLQSIIDKSLDGSMSADVVVVISNNSKAKALKRAVNHGIDALHISAVTEGSDESADKRTTDEMVSRGVDLVVLAGYMKKIGPELLNAYKGDTPEDLQKKVLVKEHEIFPQVIHKIAEEWEN